MLTAAEKIRTICKRRKLSLSALAEQLGSTRQNLSNKLSRNNFTEKEIREIAVAMNCEYEVIFTMKDTGERI